MHASDCGMNNGPALPQGVCDCGAWPVRAEVGTVYRHRKGGLYEVVALAKAEATLEYVVVYLGKDGQTWTRPVAEFCDGRFIPQE